MYLRTWDFDRTLYENIKNQGMIDARNTRFATDFLDSHTVGSCGIVDYNFKSLVEKVSELKWIKDFGHEILDNSAPPAGIDSTTFTHASIYFDSEFFYLPGGTESHQIVPTYGLIPAYDAAGYIFGDHLHSILTSYGLQSTNGGTGIVNLDEICLPGPAGTYTQTIYDPGQSNPWTSTLPFYLYDYIADSTTIKGYAHGYIDKADEEYSTFISDIRLNGTVEEKFFAVFFAEAIYSMDDPWNMYILEEFKISTIIREDSPKLESSIFNKVFFSRYDDNASALSEFQNHVFVKKPLAYHLDNNQQNTAITNLGVDNQSGQAVVLTYYNGVTDVPISIPNGTRAPFLSLAPDYVSGMSFQEVYGADPYFNNCSGYTFDNDISYYSYDATSISSASTQQRQWIVANLLSPALKYIDPPQPDSGCSAMFGLCSVSDIFEIETIIRVASFAIAVYTQNYVAASIILMGEVGAFDNLSDNQRIVLQVAMIAYSVSGPNVDTSTWINASIQMASIAQQVYTQKQLDDEKERLDNINNQLEGLREEQESAERELEIYEAQTQFLWSGYTDEYDQLFSNDKFFDVYA